MIYYHPLQYEGSPLFAFNPKDQTTRKELYGVNYTPVAAIGSTFFGGSFEVSHELMALEMDKFAGYTMEGSYYILNDILYASVSLEAFADLLSTDSPAPGGGSVAALCLALSGALSTMVANLTVDKKGYDEVQEIVRELAPRGQEIKLQALQCIDSDTDAFNAMMAATRLPKKTEQEITARNAEVEKTTQQAILVPLRTLELAWEAMQLSDKIADAGNTNALSDAGVAALTALSAAKAADYNILINLSGSSDEAFKADIKTRAGELVNKCQQLAESIETKVRDRI